MSRDVIVVRVYIKETDQGRRGNLMQEIVRLLHDQHRVAGLTVFRGIAGFGASGEVHSSDMLRLAVDLPLVIEFFDAPNVVEEVLKLVKDLVPNEHILCWPATMQGGAQSPS
jgi:PII-like signaling protein